MHVMKSLHILCFGDSITAGWSHGGAVIHPYADAMLGSLEKALKTYNITADVQGNPGDQVTTPPGGFLTRMDILYEENEAPYDWAVILGGTNDLNNNRAGDDIYEALKKVWAYPLRNGTKVLALSVPECGFCTPDLNDRRYILNDLILDHEADNFYTLDFSSKMPYWRMPVERRDKIWDDGVHFTEKGYDLMGEIIAKRLIGLIRESKSVEKTQKPLRSGLKIRSLDSAQEIRQVEGRKLGSGRVLVRGVEVIE